MESKPREWRILFVEGTHEALYDQTEELPEISEGDEELVHVIEHSAYQKAIEERDEYRVALEQQRAAHKYVCQQSIAIELAKERGEERAKSVKLVEVLKAIICNGPMSVEEHSTRADNLARVALEEYSKE